MIDRDSENERHAHAVRRLAEQYRQEGFDVEIEPDADHSPAFLGGYRPDLIVRGGDRSIIVEVRGGGGGSGESLREIAERVAGEPGWTFELLFLGKDPDDIQIPGALLSEPEIEDRIRRASLLSDQGSSDTAFLLLWIAVEASLRNLADRSSLPIRNTPASILARDLYTAGMLGREQMHQVLGSLRERNAIVHGFTSAPSKMQLNELDALARGLLDELRQAVV